ncbi:unnamed protein product [Schistocephalus solidus]|uniref:Mitochondrial import inner membrane translocase subunit n=1 Tax=Schistocephalus solidus TaxID=70667 RepID=A0A183T6Z0_SCHSO|nr:unnamed protein product [Schistocephalus solidus]
MTKYNEMKVALQKLQTQAEFQNQVSNLTGRCWDLCYTGTPGAKLDDKRANCLKNCVERYIDVSNYTGRLAKISWMVGHNCIVIIPL